MTKTSIEPSWYKQLTSYLKTKRACQLEQFINTQYQENILYPKREVLFNAFNLCPFDKVKVIILGQDPYHGQNQAHGLSFSVPNGVKIPPSLRNIFKELQNDLHIPPPNHGNLESWATQGVFLLNSILTVKQNAPASHRKKGWEEFSSQAIKTLSDNKKHLVFMLWGAHAQNNSSLIDATKHLILTSTHPSPLSVYKGFLGCKHFSQCNHYLEVNKITPINWCLKSLNN